MPELHTAPTLSRLPRLVRVYSGSGYDVWKGSVEIISAPTVPDLPTKKLVIMTLQFLPLSLSEHVSNMIYHVWCFMFHVSCIM